MVPFTDLFTKAIGLAETEALARAVIEQHRVEELITATLDHSREVSFRAAWTLENVMRLSPDSIVQYRDLFMQSYATLQHRSSRRHFSFIAIRLSLTRNLLTQPEKELLIEKTFGWLLDPEAPVAVKANCIELIYTLRDTDDWIAGELREIILRELQNGTPAIQSRGRKFLAKL
jgi:hypothetical protein